MCLLWTPSGKRALAGSGRLQRVHLPAASLAREGTSTEHRVLAPATTRQQRWRNVPPGPPGDGWSQGNRTGAHSQLHAQGGTAAAPNLYPRSTAALGQVPLRGTKDNTSTTQVWGGGDSSQTLSWPKPRSSLARDPCPYLRLFFVGFSLKMTTRQRSKSFWLCSPKALRTLEAT